MVLVSMAINSPVVLPCDVILIPIVVFQPAYSKSFCKPQTTSCLPISKQSSRPSPTFFLFKIPAQGTGLRGLCPAMICGDIVRVAPSILSSTFSAVCYFNGSLIRVMLDVRQMVPRSARNSAAPLHPHHASRLSVIFSSSSA